MAKIRKSTIKGVSGLGKAVIPVIGIIGAIFILHALVSRGGPANATDAGYSTSASGGGGDSAVPAPSGNTGLLESITGGIDRLLNRQPQSQQPSQQPPINFRLSPAPAYGGPNPGYNQNVQAQNPSPTRHVRTHLSSRTRQALDANAARTQTRDIPITRTDLRVQQLEQSGHAGFRAATRIGRQRGAAAAQRIAQNPPPQNTPSPNRNANQFQNDLLSKVRNLRRS